MILGSIRKHLGETVRELTEQMACQIVEGNLLFDHVHIGLAISKGRV